MLENKIIKEKFKNMFDIDSAKLAIVGLGYVGLPLAVEFGKTLDVVGFDIDNHRVTLLNDGVDETNEVSQNELRQSINLKLSSSKKELCSSNVYIVTVPTPVDSTHRPDLTPLKSASKMVGEVLSKGNIVIYESTVYPGATEEECVPILESVSGLKFNRDFFVGYSPERINPGDKEHTVTTIKKVTSGSTIETANFIDELYNIVVKAGTHKAPSIKVAEAAKVIENTQRDLNIAFVNELAMIFSHLDIDTHAVLDAAMTKWNFLPFSPGLVGGHCISVDPYYLTHKAQSLGYIPDIILSARRINNEMPAYVVDRMIKAMIKKRIHVNGSKILIMGFTFKENCPDVRNTKIVDVVDGLKKYGVEVDVYDSWIDIDNMGFDINFIDNIEEVYDGILLAVPHDEFKQLGKEKISSYAKENNVIFDLKAMFDVSMSDLRL